MSDAAPSAIPDRWTLPALDDELRTLLESEVPLDEEEGDLRQSFRKAEVLDHADDRLLLRLDDGTNAWCPLEEAEAPGLALPRPGDTVEVLVEEQDQGAWRVALRKAALVRAWEELRALGKAKGSVEGTIEYTTRAGFIVSTPHARAFLPGRESGIPRTAAGDWIGRSLSFDVLRFERSSGELILSRRKSSQEDRKKHLARAMETLEEGQLVRGIVRRIAPFGAFVEIEPGVEGLLHVSEMDVERIEDPASALDVGETLELRVVRIDAERGRIGLSRRDIAAKEQQELLRTMEAGVTVQGTVSRLADFGAFIAIPPGVEGLCHISEFSWTQRIGHPSEMLAEGDEVSVFIQDVDADNQRISLSLRRTTENPWASVAEEMPAGATVTGTITRIEDYGLFLRIAEGVEGLCHISDLTWEGRPEKPSDAGTFAIGDEIEVKVLEIDTDRQRVRLGIKQLSGDPWAEAEELLQQGAVVQATVTRFDDQAAWLSVAEGVEGRMHISQISTERIDTIRAALRMGQEVDVMITRVDLGRRRLDLSIRAILEAEEANAPRSHADEGVMNPLAAALAARAEGGETDGKGDEAGGVAEAAPDADEPAAGDVVEAAPEADEPAAGEVVEAAPDADEPETAAGEVVEAAPDADEPAAGEVVEAAPDADEPETAAGEVVEAAPDADELAADDEAEKV